MAMTAAELVAYLRLDKRGFTKGMQDAERQMAGASGNFRKWAGGMGQAAAGTITTTATAAAALGAQVFKTGIEYNTLQQSSRAALTTIMGGGEKANAQMDKLDAFAKNSPFSKAVFIQAQQQLLGFGMTAEDVVPTLDAIQNAVAAVGGSNDDIAEISNVLATVTGTGKITAQTLNQLGLRGINAAEIIGKEMGKSGNEIRTSISKGTLDADKAMAALTKGMQKRFGGAAAGVKETMTGAADRVKAAWRDVGSKLAAPFVDPKGGGIAIDWFNQFADVIRAVESKTKPFVDMMMSRFAPAFQKVSATLLDAKDAVDRFDLSSFERGLDKVGQQAPAVAAVSAALFTMGTKNIPIIGGLTSALGPIPAALAAAAAASPQMRSALGEVWDALKPLGPDLADLADTLGVTFTEAVGLAADILHEIVGFIKPVVDGFVKLPEPVKQVALAFTTFLAVQKLFPGFTTAVAKLGTGIIDRMKGLGTHIAGVPGAFRDWKGAMSGASGSMGDFRAAASLTMGSIGTAAGKGLRGALGGVVNMLGGPWGIAIAAAGTALTIWAQKQQEAAQRAKEIAETLDENTQEITNSTREVFADKATEVNGFWESMWDSSKKWGDSTKDDLEKVGVSLSDYVDVLDGTITEEQFLKKIREGMASQSDQSIANSKSMTEASQRLGKTIEKESEATKKAKKDEKDKKDALKESEEATDEAKRSLDRYNEATKAATDSSNGLESQVRGLNNALDELHGEEKNQEQADRDLADSQRSVKEFLNDTENAAAIAKDGFINLKDGTIGTSEAGNEFSRIMDNQTDAMKASAIAAYNSAGGQDNAEVAARAASKAYRDQIDELKAQLKATGLSDKKVNALIKSMDNVPDEIYFSMRRGQKELSKTDLAVLQLNEQLKKTPNKKNIIIDDNSKATKKRMKELGLEVEELPDGTISVTVPKGELQNVKRKLDEAVKPREVTINAVLGPMAGVTSGLTGLANQVASAAKSKGKKGKRADGGIDVMGMADGGVTGRSMQVAQMVSPGDIRFAGDRSDVDEAWIPLDGSTRSWKILTEALKRMPGQAGKGMAEGGVTATVTPPTVDGVEKIDTTPLTEPWADAMTRMLADTERAFQDIRKDTATSTTQTVKDTKASQAAQTADTSQGAATRTNTTRTANAAQVKDTKSSNAAKAKDTKTSLSGMQANVKTSMTTMDKQTKTSLSNMQAHTKTSYTTMGKQTDTSLTGMKRTANTIWNAIAKVTRTQAANMRTSADREFTTMHRTGTRQLADLRTSGLNSLGTLHRQGVQEISDMRSGMVTQMGHAQGGFKTELNGLISVLAKFSKEVNKAYGDYSVDVGTPAKFATGGILPGYTPGKDVHQFVSPTGGRLNLSGGEGILRPEVVKAIGVNRFNGLNAAARSGGVSAVRDALGTDVPEQSFADGGFFESKKAITKKGNQIKQKYMGMLGGSNRFTGPAGDAIIAKAIQGAVKAAKEDYDEYGGGNFIKPTKGRITSGYGSSRGQYPHAGVDFAAPGGGPTWAAAPGRVVRTGWNIVTGRTGIGAVLDHGGGYYTYYGHNPPGGLRVKEGDKVKAKDPVGRQGSTGHATGTHLHWEVQKGGIGKDVDPMPYLKGEKGYGGGAGGGVGAPGGKGVTRWTNQVRRALAANGLPTGRRYVNAWLSQIRTESGGNPRAKQGIIDINSMLGMPAQGLLQTIPPTFMAYSHPGHKQILNGYDNMLAAMAYAKSRYGKSGMLGVIGHGHGYARGTESAQPGFHWVGEQGPELMRFRGGETVRNNNRSRTMAASSKLTREDARMIAHELAAATSRDGFTINGPVTTQDPQELFRQYDKITRRRNAVRARI